MASAKVIQSIIKALRQSVPCDSVLEGLKPFRVDPNNLNFFKDFPEEIEILKVMAIHPASTQKVLYDPFHEEEVENNFRNIGYHCLAVAACTRIISVLLEEKSIITAEESREAVRRAMLHDAIKPYEVFLGRAVSSGRISEAEYYRPEIFDPVKNCLLKSGLGREIVNYLVDDIGAETNARECFYELWEINANKEIGLVDGRWPWKLVQLADNMTYSPSSGHLQSADSYFLTSWERIAVAENHIRYPWAEISGIGIQNDSLVFMNDVLNPEAGVEPFLVFHDCYIWNSNLIARDILKLLDVPSSNPEVGIKNIVNTRISVM